MQKEIDALVEGLQHRLRSSVLALAPSSALDLPCFAGRLTYGGWFPYRALKEKFWMLLSVRVAT